MSGFFDDFWRSSGVAALGEFVGGEELGVAVIAVARAQEVEQALLGDLDGARWEVQVAGRRLQLESRDVGRIEWMRIRWSRSSRRWAEFRRRIVRRASFLPQALFGNAGRAGAQGARMATWRP